MSTRSQISDAKNILRHSRGGPNRLVDVKIGEALGWRVDHDSWWNCRGNQDPDGPPVFDPPGDGWCIRRDNRSDVPCNEALPTFTFIVRQDAMELIDQMTRGYVERDSTEDDGPW